MARVKFDEKYVSAELEKVGNVLTSPVILYLIGGAAISHDKIWLKSCNEGH